MPNEIESFLAHYGVKGMKWGVRKAAPTKLSSSSARTSTTRKVIKDYNSMDDKEFRGKYAVSKKTYAKRVEKKGDPYEARTSGRLGKKLVEKEKKMEVEILKDFGEFFVVKEK